MVNFKDTPFPDPKTPDSIKREHWFGENVAKAIIGNTSTYRAERDKQIAQNRVFARGEQPITPYMNVLSSDGKTLWTNIIYAPRPVVSKFEEIVVNGYMEQEEYPKVTSMSKHVKDKKDRKKDEAKFRMQYNQVIQELSQASGIPMEDPSAFVPRTQEELDVWFSMNDKEREEILLQRMLTFTAEDIDIQELKQRVLSEQFQAGLHGVYSYMDVNHRLRVDFIQAEDCIYDTFKGEKSNNLGFAGRFIPMKVSDLRRRWALDKKQEKALYEVVVPFAGKYGNPAGARLTWNDQYTTSNVRPYDNWVVPIAHVWWKCNRNLTYIEGKDRYGREVFKTVQEEPTNLDKNKSTGKTYPLTAYSGYFIVSGSVMCLEWGEEKNILRQGEDKDELLCPFIYRMPGNKGEMKPNSPTKKIIPDVMEMDILDLKIKTAIARSAPSGYAIDVDTLASLDLGEGIGIASPITLIDIYRSTGFLYYKSKSDSGENTLSPPIRENQVGLDPQITGFLEIYNWHRNEIREILGINEFRDGSATSPRIGYRYAQSQLSQSNTATLSLYRSWLTTGTDLFRHIGIRIWDSLAFGTPNKGYLKFLGEKDAEFIRSAKEITASSYDVKYEMGMTLRDREDLEANIQTALAAGTIDTIDAISIRDVDDVKLAYQILKVRAETKRRERMEEAEQNSRMAAEANAQAGVQVEQAKAESNMAIAQAQAQVKAVQGESDRDRAMENLVWDLIREEQKGNPIPEQYLPIIDMVLQNRGLSQVTELQQKEQASVEQEQMAMQEQEMGGVIPPTDMM